MRAGWLADRENFRARRDAESQQPGNLSLNVKTSNLGRCCTLHSDQRRADFRLEQVHRPTPRADLGVALDSLRTALAQGQAPMTNPDAPPCAVQDPEIPPVQLPSAASTISADCHRLLPGCVLPSAYNTEHPPCRDSADELTPLRLMSIITGHRMCWLSADATLQALGASSLPSSPRTASCMGPSRNWSSTRFPISAVLDLNRTYSYFHNRRSESVNRNRRCLKDRCNTVPWRVMRVPLRLRVVCRPWHARTSFFPLCQHH